MSITLAQLDREIRAALRRAGIDPRRASVVLYKPLDREHARNRRRYAQVIPTEMRFEFARATLEIDAAHRRALVAHEVGHVVEFRRKGRHTEADADRAARRAVGVPVCYDRRWPGKGLQVDCRARAKNPPVPFPVAAKPPVPFHRFRESRPARVNVADLIATQPAVSDHGLRKYSSGGGKRPMIARKDGRLYIMDGHHRATSALAQGETTIDVRLLDLDTEDLMARSTNPKQSNPPEFTGNESAEIQHRILLCAESVAEHMGVDRVIETYHDTSKSSPTMEIKFKFVPRVPTQRHLTLVTNPKAHGFKPAQAELIREEFEYCAGRWAEDNRLMISYKNPKPTPKAIPIRMVITRRPHKQHDLFGNPRGRQANAKDPLRKFQDEGWPLREDMQDTGERVPWPIGSVVTYLDDSGYHDSQVVVAHPTWIYHAGMRNLGVHTGHSYHLLDEAGFKRSGGAFYVDVVEPRDYWPATLPDVIKKVKRSAPKSAANPTIIVGEFVAIDVDDDDLEQLAANPRKLTKRQAHILATIRDATPSTQHRLGAAGVKWAMDQGLAYAPAGHPGEIRLTSEGHDALRAYDSGSRAKNPAPRQKNPRVQRMSRKITGL